MYVALATKASLKANTGTFYYEGPAQFARHSPYRRLKGFIIAGTEPHAVGR